MLHARARLLVATVWAGSLWTVGYLVAPTLFATLADRVLAGTVAASMFRSEAWLSIACAVLMLVLLSTAKGSDARRTRTTALIVLAMLAATLCIHFGVQPLMAELRETAGPAGVMESASRARFGILHGISSAIYLTQSVLAGVLLFRST